MKNHAALLTHASAQVCQAADGLVDPSILRHMQRQVEEKCASLQPCIMLYGLYNAGKSTLLNALLGRQAAAVSDIPETTAVSEYDWHGYRIFDTPGLDAPVAHEVVTRTHLAKVEVVILVVSTSGSAEEERLYQEIATLAADKRVLVVLNLKSDLSEEECLAIYTQVAGRLAQRLPAMADRIPLLMVNAASALKARLENKLLLLRDSNIAQLEREIVRMMATTTSGDAVRTAAALVDPVLKQAEMELEKAIRNSGRKTSESVQISAHLKLRFRQLRNEGHALIAQKCQEATARIRDSISEQSPIDDEFCQMVLGECLQDVAAGLKQLVDDYLDEVTRELGQVLAAPAPLPHGSLAGGGAAMPSGKSAGGDDRLAAISARLRDFNPEMAQQMLLNLAKIAGKTANKCPLPWMKELLIWVGKKAKWTSKLLGPAAIFIECATNLFCLVSGHRQDQAEFEEKKAMVHAANQMMNDIQDRLKAELGRHWETDSSEIWKRTALVLTEITASDSAAEADSRARLERLAEAKNTLRQLRQDAIA